MMINHNAPHQVGTNDAGASQADEHHTGSHLHPLVASTSVHPPTIAAAYSGVSPLPNGSTSAIINATNSMVEHQNSWAAATLSASSHPYHSMSSNLHQAYYNSHQHMAAYH